SLENYNKAITDKDLQITSLQSSLENYNKAIADKDLQITSLQSSLDDIHQSFTWRLLRKYDDIVDKMKKSSEK
ncbi:MAG: hypothetical protein WAN47_10480, partial [Nitrosotalea sp.]